MFVPVKGRISLFPDTSGSQKTDVYKRQFHDLARYEDKSFWEANPYFYIYTPDGREIVYHIYSAGVVKDTSDTYLTEFASDEEYQEFLNMTRDVAAYDTGIMPDVGDQIVTLSTCTKDSNEDRFVVRGDVYKRQILYSLWWRT